MSIFLYSLIYHPIYHQFLSISALSYICLFHLFLQKGFPSTSGLITISLSYTFFKTLLLYNFFFKTILSLFPIAIIISHCFSSVQFSSVAQLCLTLCDPQHARPPCPSPTPRVYSNSCPSSWWCHPAILSSVIPFSSCLQSFPTLGSFPMSQLFA